MDVENGIYDMNNQLKKATFEYDKEGRFYIGVSKVESLDGGKQASVVRYLISQGKLSPLMVTRNKY